MAADSVVVSAAGLVPDLVVVSVAATVVGSRPFVFYSFTVEFYSLCFEIFYSETVENSLNLKYSTVSHRNCRKHSEAVDRTTFFPGNLKMGCETRMRSPPSLSFMTIVSASDDHTREISKIR